MEATICQGPGRRSWDEVPDPVIGDPADFALSDMEAAYRMSADPASTGAIKIAAFRDGFRDERAA